MYSYLFSRFSFSYAVESLVSGSQHYYYGLTIAILMIISLTILPEIYRNFTWRRIHITLNVIALMLFLGQSVTGVRDLLEIPISWQEPTIFGCDFKNQVCGALPKSNN